MVRIAEDGSRVERVSLPALFIGFLKVAFCSIGGGGGIVFSRRLVVEQQRLCGHQLGTGSSRAAHDFFQADGRGYGRQL
jgi:hypothetical protein